MFQTILQQNFLYYAMVVFCILGIVSQGILRLLYGQMRKDMRRSGTPKTRFIKQIHQKYQNGSRMKQGEINTMAMIRRNLLEFRFAGLDLHGWNRIAGLSIGLSLICGLAGWYFGHSANYLLSAGLSCLLLVGSYGLMDNGYLGKSLETELLDALENTCFLHAAVGEDAAFAPPREMEEQDKILKRVKKETPAKREKRDLKENISRIREGIRESAVAEEKKERNSEVIRQMNVEEQERVIREVLKEFLT